MPKRPIAAVTMVYNEAIMLPLWLRHYARQVGAENCYVLDHGSDDGSTRGIAANVIRLPRTPLNERDRVQAVSNFCATLFIGYAHVLYTDADELVLPDPEAAATLGAYMETREHPAILDLFGGDVHHVAGEPDIDLARPVSEQRGHLRPISTLCKPTLISRRTDWHVGFHCVVKDHRPEFRDLYLFHLAYCDDGLIRARQKKRNAAPPVDVHQSHHALSPEEILATMRASVADLSRRPVEMRPGEPGFEATKRLFADAIERKDWAQAPDLWRLPERFVGAF